MDKPTLKKIAKVIKELDSTCWEVTSDDATRIRIARGQLFDVLIVNGYFVSEDYKLVKK
jgi:hypothetical protein